MFLILFAGCDKSMNNGDGRLVIKITDAPFPIDNIESATVTISKVEIRKQEMASVMVIRFWLHGRVRKYSTCLNLETVWLKNYLILKFQRVSMTLSGYMLIRQALR